MTSKCMRELQRRFQSGEGELASLGKSNRQQERWATDCEKMPWVPLMESPSGPVSVLHINSEALARVPDPTMSQAVYIYWRLGSWPTA